MDYTRRDLLALMGTAGALGRYGDAAAQDAAANAVSRWQPSSSVTTRLCERRFSHRFRSGQSEPGQRARSVRPAFGRVGERRRRNAGCVVRPSPVGVSSVRRAPRTHPDRCRLPRTCAKSPGQRRPAHHELQLSARHRFVVHNVATAAAIGRLHGAEEIAVSFARFSSVPGRGWRKAAFTRPTTAR